MERCARCPPVDRSLLPVKGLFFLELGSVSTLLLYLTLFLETELGLSKTEIAVSSFLAPFLGFLSRPAFGVLADRFKAFRLVLLFLLVSNGISFSMLLTVPRAGPLSAANSSQPGNATAPSLRCTPGFLLSLLWRSLGYLAYTPIVCLTDAAAMALLGARRARYGHQRVFGSLGFFLCSLATSAAMQLSQRWFLPPFLLYGVETALACLLLVWLRVPDTARCDSGLWRSLRTVWGSGEMRLVAASAGLGGGCLAVVESYVFLGVKAMLRPPDFLFGLMTACMCLSETPVMAASGAIIRRLGEVNVVCLGFLFWALRFLVYSLVTSAWQVLLNELLHGFTFGLLLSALVTHASRLSPPGSLATVQGLLSGLHFGLGVAVGGLIGGVLVDRLGFRLFFRLCSVYAVACCVIVFLVHRCLRLRSSATHKEEEEEEEEIA